MGIYSENLRVLGCIVLEIEQKLFWAIEYLKFEKMPCMHQFNVFIYVSVTPTVINSHVFTCKVGCCLVEGLFDAKES